VLDLRPVELGGGLELLGVELDATGDGSLCFLAVFEADLLTSEERLGVAKLRESTSYGVPEQYISSMMKRVTEAMELQDENWPWEYTRTIEVEKESRRMYIRMPIIHGSYSSFVKPRSVSDAEIKL